MKNHIKLERLGAVPLYYYIKPNGRRLATICLIVKEDRVLSRGVAVCSPEDVFLKRKGRAMACGRAMQAISHVRSLLPVNHKRKFQYGKNDVLKRLKFDFKAVWKPKLTGFEKKLVDKAKVPISA